MAEEVFCGHIFPEFSNHLNSASLRALWNTSASCRAQITPEIIQKVALREIYLRLARDLPDEMERILGFLFEHSGIISGSFIAQCILGEFWKGSDIDIFVPVEEDADDEMLRRHLQLDDLLWICCFANAYRLKAKNIHATVYEYHFTGCITRRMRRIHIIYVKMLSKDDDKSPFAISLAWRMIAFVRYSFDMDFLKNVFGIDNQGQPFLDIFTSRELMQKRAIINPYCNTAADFIKRCTKYYQRGFDFSDIEHLTWDVIERCALNSEFIIPPILCRLCGMPFPHIHNKSGANDYIFQFKQCQITFGKFLPIYARQIKKASKRSDKS